MKTRIYILVFAMLSIYGFSQTLFYENFNGISGPTSGGEGTYKFPTGWLLRNVDNRTPNSHVSYVNEAWERREDFKFNIQDSCAFSTSYYSPAGVSDDWMWTPKINLPNTNNTITLSWRANAYDPEYADGYEVRIMTSPNEPTGGTGVMGNQVTASTLLLNIPNENSVWTTRTVDLSAYKNQDVRIAFRNKSTDKFLLVIDDVKVDMNAANDIALTNVLNYEYTKIPVAQAGSFPLSATIKNISSNTQSGITIKASLINASDNTVLETQYSEEVNNLQSNETATPAFPILTGQTKGDFYVKYEVVFASDGNPDNNVLSSSNFSITEATMARDNTSVDGTLGIGANMLGYLGQSFTTKTEVIATGGTVSFKAPTQGGTYQLALWDMNLATNKPNQIIAETEILTFENTNDLTTTLSFVGGPKVLLPGTYVLTAVERDKMLTIAVTKGIFTPGTTFINWADNPQGNWAHNEDFGANFTNSYAIRLEIPRPMSDVDGNLHIKKGSDGDGSSWDNAIGELADAITYVDAINKEFPGTFGTLRVAAGSYNPLYRPDNKVRSFTDKRNSFLLPKDVTLIGGFSGDMTKNAERNLTANETILDANIGLINDNVDNVSHLVMAVGDVGTTTLDGFTFSNAYNVGNTQSLMVDNLVINPTKGAGFYLLNASPSIKNSKITINLAGTGGGAIYAENASPDIINTYFYGNMSWENAAGIYNKSSNPSIVNSAFVANNLFQNTGNGGAIYNDASSPLILNSTIRGNIASTNGGGVYNTNVSSPKIYNSIIFQNQGGSTGDIFNSNDSTPDIKSSGIGSQLDANHTFVGNNPLETNYITLLNDNANIAHDGGNKTLYNVASFGNIDLLGGTRLKGNSIDMGAVEIQDGTLSVEDFNKNSISIYPNPVTDSRFYINNSNSRFASIFDMSGKLIKTISLEKGVNHINIQLQEGVYIIKTDDNKSEKLIVK